MDLIVLGREVVRTVESSVSDCFQDITDLTMNDLDDNPILQSLNGNGDASKEFGGVGIQSRVFRWFIKTCVQIESGHDNEGIEGEDRFKVTFIGLVFGPLFVHYGHIDTPIFSDMCFRLLPILIVCAGRREDGLMLPGPGP